MLKQIPKLTLPLVAFLLLFQISFAQRTITGRITDAEGAGVPGVTVTVRGTNTATQTGADGSYTITAPDNATLVMTAVGYTTQEVSAGNAEAVTLQTNASNLNEVVVVGYGTARRRDVTGSVATVRAKDFNKGVIVSPEQAIQGKAAGVMVINNSGQPGGATTIRIRGTSSIRSGNQP
ncbi:MAG TPA: carboxypeptidase-like regulatory domain-containing protein, partial [Chitinophagaceae bacterium]|nr:carboxypeptidase-like regulatory domain-containing protein [Chitinophagaceae bacterium]